MEVPFVSELFGEEPPTRRASWTIPRVVTAVPSWIAPATSTEPADARTPPPPKLPAIEHVEELRVAPEVHDKRDTEELARLGAEIEQLRAEVARAAVLVARMRAELLRDSEPELVRLATAIAERVVGRELETRPAAIVDWAREGLAALGGKRVATVAVAPDIARAFDEEGRSLLGVAVVIDESLAPGACVVRSEDARVDVSASARIRGVAEALESAEEQA